MVILTIAGAGLGVAAGFMNALISKKALRSEKVSSLFAINAIRFAVDAVCLIIVFFLCRWTGISMLFPLLFTALGLTIGGAAFLIRLTGNNPFRILHCANSTDKIMTSEKETGDGEWNS